MTQSGKKPFVAEFDNSVFKKIIENCNQGIIIHQNFKPLFVNEHWAKIHGVSVDEVMALESILPFFDAPEKDRVEIYAKTRLTESDVPDRYNYYGRHKNGRTLHLQNHVQIMSFGENTAIVSMISDIQHLAETEKALQESQLRFKTLLDNSPMAIYFKDREGRFLVANRAYENIYNVGPDDYIGKKSIEIYPLEISKDYDRHDQDVVKSGKTIVQEDVLHGRVLMVVKFPVFNDEKQIIGLGGVEMDVTDMKKNEDVLLQAKHEAELANRTKSEFLANMSHELRTPLNSIIGFSEMMLQEVFGPLGHKNYQDYSEDIHFSGTHLLKVIGDILDISKIEAGEFKLSESQVNIIEIIEFCVRMIRDKADKSDVTLVVKVDTGLPTMQCDPVRLKQILLNLLSNAVKFSSQDTKITIHAFIDDDGALVVSVSDQGPGIYQKNIDKIFKPFEQLRRTSHVAHEGTGLGLYLTKTLVEMHGGTINVDSKINAGTTFSLRFPKERLSD